MNVNRNSIERQVTLDGMMSFGMLKTGLRTADFECCEDVEVEAYEGNFKVQMMRDGNVYMTEMKKRIRNRAIFRDDNCSLSLGQNGRYYFVFTLPEELIEELPAKLVHQASAIAQKVMAKSLGKGGVRG